ncbi:hypothetical protein [Nocardioides convexus]|uniref:hypothetical protein n=1 Tax=Nocardioides convexus TaxID=2712224 RepID=UPI0024184803|nr:hypothetical protein [Nocardioides convexus]
MIATTATPGHTPLESAVPRAGVRAGAQRADEGVDRGDPAGRDVRRRAGAARGGGRAGPVRRRVDQRPRTAGRGPQGSCGAGWPTYDRPRCCTARRRGVRCRSRACR